MAKGMAEVKELLPSTCEHVGCGNAAGFQIEGNQQGRYDVGYRCWQCVSKYLGYPDAKIYSLKTNKRILHAYDAR